MTVIAGIEQDGKITMACDSMGSNGHSYNLREEPKIFMNNEFLIGYTSSFRFGQLMQYSLTLPTKDEHIGLLSKDVHKYLCTTFIDSVRSCLKSGGFARKSSEVESIEGGCLIGYKGALWEMQSDYQIAKCPDGLGAVGSGGLATLSALHATSKKDKPKKRLEQALEAANKVIMSISGPFHYLEI